MPSIYLQTSDGTRIELPVGAEEISDLVRHALDIWEEKHCVQDSLSEEDSDNICTNSRTDSERTPDRIMDDDDTSTYTRSLAGNRDDDTAEYRNSHDNDVTRLRDFSPDTSDDPDRTASFLDDDEDYDNDNTTNTIDDEDRTGSLTPSTCPSVGSASPLMASSSPPARGQRKTPRRGSRARAIKADGDNASGALDFEGGAGAVQEHVTPCENGVNTAKEWCSCTSNTLGSEEEDAAAAAAAAVVVGVGKEDGMEKFSLNAGGSLPTDEENPPIHGDPHALETKEADDDDSSSSPSSPSPSSSSTSSVIETTSTVVEAEMSNRGTSNENGKTVNVKLASSNNKMDVGVKQNESSRVIIYTPSAMEDDERCVSGDRLSVIPSPRSLTNEEFFSPTGYHQRTPCMIGDEDESLLLGDGTISPINEGLVAFSVNKESHSPGPSSAKNTKTSIEPSPKSPTPNRMAELNTSNIRPRSNVRSSSTESGNNTSGRAGGAQSSDDDTTVDINQCFIISEHEIVIKVHNAALSIVPKASSIDNELQSHSSLGNSTRNQLVRHRSNSPNNPITSSSMILPSYSEGEVESKTTGVESSSLPTRTSRISGGSASTSSPVMSEALRLCVAYMLHFAKGSEYGQHAYPTKLPEPLTAPLVRFLTKWEREFLYREILGYTEEEVRLALEILQCAPKMSYTYPVPFLNNPAVCAALMVKPPAAGRVRLLTSVKREAEMLKIMSLTNMCIAWLADYTIRVSYASVNCFESALRLQQCFSVRNDWTRKEMDSLKLENEWPGNEEE